MPMFEMLVGLAVTDNEIYEQYRSAMKPILTQFGGDFGYDLRVSEVLKSPDGAPINRLFTINFPTEAHMNEFFSDPSYLDVKQTYFTRSVLSTSIIASYLKAD
jgi:uncharacterized protein (DUF1330 family)